MTTYSEGPESYIQHNGLFYQLDTIFELTKDLPVRPMILKDLIWVIDSSKKDPHPDFAKRVKEADETIPIIVIREKNKWIPIDGFHRIHKAQQKKRTIIPVKVMTKIMLEKARVDKLPVKRKGK